MSKQTKATEQTKSVEKKVIKSKETKAAPKETKAAPKEVIISGEEPINPPLSKVELGTTGLEYTELEATKLAGIELAPIKSTVTEELELDAVTKKEVLRIAKTCHQVNKSFCEFIGDSTQVNWEDAPDWQKDSAVKGVKFVIENPDADNFATHNSWLKEKEAAGWTFGIVKNVETKEHPCILPYDELPKSQRFKDELFRTIVKSLA